MNKITTLEDLYIKETSNLYNAEFRISKILQQVIKKISSSELKETLENYFEQTQLHIDRLEKIFKSKKINPSKKKCAAMEGLAEEAEVIAKINAKPVIKDIAILSHVKKINHYEIAGYGCAVIYAKMLWDNDNMDILQATLDEEIETEEILSEIAEDTLINETAEEWEEEDQVL